MCKVAKDHLKIHGPVSSDIELKEQKKGNKYVRGERGTIVDIWLLAFFLLCHGTMNLISLGFSPLCTTEQD